MRKLISFLFALAASVGMVCASDTEVNGIWYDFDDDAMTATVTFRGSDYDSYSDRYKGDVAIPESVTYNAKTYSVTSIGEGAFYECRSLTSVTIPNSVTSIGNWAFGYCTSLTSVTIPNSVTSIGEGAFYYCRSLTSIDIPNSVTSIGREAFGYCRSLTSITIPNSVTSIKEQAFARCTSLTSVIIGNSVTSIGSFAFQSCSSLTSIIVESGNSMYDSRDNCNAIIETSTNTLIAGCQNTVIPNSVTSIGDGAFAGCSSLTSIIIPNSVTSIDEGAFAGCSSLTSITIPNSVTSIGDYAFQYCSGLTSVYNYAATPQSIGSDVFYDVNKTTCTLYVPEESIELYRAADVWKAFGSIVGIDTSDTPTAAPVVVNPANKAQKLIRNGNVYILTETKTYNVQGLESK